MHKHSKYLWVLLLIVILYFIIKNLFKKTYFEALTANFNEDASDDEKADELALYFANGLKPPEKEEPEPQDYTSRLLAAKKKTWEKKKRKD